jgi:hypothetical protein
MRIASGARFLRSRLTATRHSCCEISAIGRISICNPEIGGTEMKQFGLSKALRAKKSFAVAVAAFIALAPASTPFAYGQSASSAQAYFGSTQNGVTVADMFAPTKLFSGQIKTSNVGSVLAGVSMECVLWTYTSTTATSGGGKNSSSARATVKVSVKVDGISMEPGQVVYCDRLQAVGVTLNTGLATDNITVELFQSTKNANHFNFYAGPLNATLHTVEVWAEGAVDCRDNTGATITCPANTLANYQTGTKVGIGKASMILQEENNTNLK